MTCYDDTNVQQKSGESQGHFPYSSDYKRKETQLVLTFPKPTPKPSEDALDMLADSLHLITDDDTRRKAWVACWHLRGALDRLAQRHNAAANAEEILNRKLTTLTSASLDADFDPHGWFVYLLWGDSTEKPLYVGQSRNILARLGAHMQDRAKWEAVRTVKLVRCSSQKVMDSTERKLIGSLRPDWNKVWNNGDYPQK